MKVMMAAVVGGEPRRLVVESKCDTPRGLEADQRRSFSHAQTPHGWSRHG